MFEHQSLQDSIDVDLAVIEDVKDIFRYRMTEQGGGISKQGLTVLDELTSFVYDDEGVGESSTSIEHGFTDVGMQYNKHMKTIMLPYFGTIRVELHRAPTYKRRPGCCCCRRHPFSPCYVRDGHTAHSRG